MLLSSLSGSVYDLFPGVQVHNTREILRRTATVQFHYFTIIFTLSAVKCRKVALHTVLKTVSHSLPVEAVYCLRYVDAR